MPTTDWDPNAPEIKQDFQNATLHKRQETTEPRTPVTKAELERLQGEREKPVLQQHYIPGGATQSQVHADINTNRENRIRYIKERLGRLQDRAREDFERSR